MNRTVIMLFLYVLCTLLLQHVAVNGFHIPPLNYNHDNHHYQKIASSYNNNIPSNSYTTTISQQRQPSSSLEVVLKMASSFDNNNYDMTKPVFDLYTFRTIRNDALNRYNVLNQSEPLRINLFLFISFVFYTFPFLAGEIIPTTQGDGIVLAPIVVSSLSVMGGIGSTLLAIRECQKRSKQLYRIEKELQALSLSIRLPQTHVFSDLPYEKAAAIASILQKKPCRIVAISGNASGLKTNLELLQVLGTTRLQQANTYIVVIPTDGSKRSDWLQQPSAEQQQQRIPWLAEPSSMEEWKNYVNGLSLSSTTSSAVAGSTASTFRWFGLNTNGMSFGSGTTSPSWLQIMGRSLLPMDIFIDNDSSNANNRIMDPAATTTKDTIPALQQKFYTALTTGDVETMLHDVFQPGMEDDEITQIIQQGGRLDPWDSCLQDNARPEGMKMVGSDFIQLSDTVAYTTIIECPQSTSIKQSTTRRTVGTLLAIQKWMLLPLSSELIQNNNMDHPDDNSILGEWKLIKHQTIPWMADTPAGGILLCDCRGCVSLVRST